MIDIIKIYEIVKIIWELVLTESYRKQSSRKFDDFKSDLVNKVIDLFTLDNDEQEIDLLAINGVQLNPNEEFFF